MQTYTVNSKYGAKYDEMEDAFKKGRYTNNISVLEQSAI